MATNVTKQEIAEFLKNSIDELLANSATNCRLILDDDLAVFVGWEGGFGDEIRTDCIQDENNPDYAIVAGLKCWRSDDMWTDYEFLNFPYFRNGDVWDSSVILKEGEDFLGLARWFLSEYEALRKYEFRDDGLILNADNYSGPLYDDGFGNLDEKLSPEDFAKDIRGVLKKCLDNEEVRNDVIDILTKALTQTKEVEKNMKDEEKKDEDIIPESFKTVVVDKLPYTSNHEATDGAVYDDFSAKRKEKIAEAMRRVRARKLREQLHPKNRK